MIDKQSIAGVVLVIGIVLAGPAHSTPQPAPAGGPLSQFEAYSEAESRRINHGQWAAILSTIFQKDARSGRSDIEYGRLGRQGRDMLKSYIRVLQKVEVSSLNRHEQLAYWLNLYNAVSTKFLYDEFLRLHTPSRQSGAQNPWMNKKIRVERFYLGKKNPWAKKTLTVEGVRLSLNDIEHRILYPIWKMPIVIYGLSCPARGCPALMERPFEGDAVVAQLKLAARQFVARKDCVSVSKGRLKASELYGQHEEMLGGAAGVIEHIREHAGSGLRAALEGIETINSEQFSWKLYGKEPSKRWDLPQGTFNRGAGRL